MKICTNKNYPLYGTYLQFIWRGMHMPNISIISHSFVRYTHSYSDPGSTAPPTTTNSPEAIPPGNSSTTAVVLTLLAIAIVLVVVLVLVFYKETRR